MQVMAQTAVMYLHSGPTAWKLHLPGKLDAVFTMSCAGPLVEGRQPVYRKDNNSSFFMTLVVAELFFISDSEKFKID